MTQSDGSAPWLPAQPAHADTTLVSLLIGIMLGLSAGGLLWG